MNTLLKTVLPLLVLVIGALGAKTLIDSRVLPDAKAPEVPIPLVTTLKAQRSDYRVHVPSQGTVMPRTESQLVVEVSGRVTSISPDFINGGFMEEGELLLQIDPRDYELAVAQAGVEMARAARRVTEEEADSEVARQEWERIGDGEPSELTLRLPQVAEAKATLVAAEAMLERAKRDLERTQVLAPFSGRVRSKSVDTGQFVSMGSSIATVYATDYAEVRLPLPDRELEFLDLPFAGDQADPSLLPEVELFADFAGKARSWSARLVRTEGELDAMTRMVMAVARVENPYGQPGAEVPLALGMFVKGTIAGHLLEDVFALPRTAVRDGERAYILDDDDRLHFVPVEIVRRERELVILRADIPEGTRIVISPIEIVTDGMQVRDVANDAKDPESKPGGNETSSAKGLGAAQ